MAERRVTNLVVEYEWWIEQRWRVSNLVVEYEYGPPPPEPPKAKRKFGPAAQTS